MFDNFDETDERIAAIFAALQPAFPKRVVQRDFVHITQHSDSDLQDGVVMLVLMMQLLGLLMLLLFLVILRTRKHFQLLYFLTFQVL